jgi:diguanylate cyclase (GGDEF)-like protein
MDAQLANLEGLAGDKVRGVRMKADRREEAPQTNGATPKEGRLGLDILEQMTRLPERSGGLPPEVVVERHSDQRRKGSPRPAVTVENETIRPSPDPLTGLPRRLMLLDRLDKALARRQLHGGNVVAIHIQLNNFGFVHDQLGANAANSILKEISRRLLSHLCNEDTVGRVGPSELLVAVSLPDDAAVAPVTERLLVVFESEFILADHAVHMWATLGTVDAQDSENAEELLDRLAQSVRLKTSGTPSAWSLSLDAR